MQEGGHYPRLKLRETVEIDIGQNMLYSGISQSGKHQLNKLFSSPAVRDRRKEQCVQSSYHRLAYDRVQYSFPLGFDRTEEPVVREDSLKPVHQPHLYLPIPVQVFTPHDIKRGSSDGKNRKPWIHLPEPSEACRALP